MSIEVTYKGSMGNDLTVCNAARVSFGKETEWDYEESDAYSFKQHLKKKDEKLIKYLAKHKHISPFGHCFASYLVRCPVFVERQLVKHSYLRMNQVSRRYVDDPPEFYTPDVWRTRSKDKKQGSGGPVDFQVTVDYDWGLMQYNSLIDRGVCPEQARMVLPQAMLTEFWWSGSLDAWAKMCNLRCKPDTQAETAEVAWEIDRVMVKLFPVSWEALRESD